MALVIAIALIAGAAALIASSARQNKEAEIRRMSGSASSARLLKDSVMAFYLDVDGASVRNARLPCPDISVPPDGVEDEAAGVCTASTGVVPWFTFKLAESDVVDAYGNYFTYAITADADARNVCTSVENSYDDTQSEYTGTLNDVTDTELRLTSQSAGQGTAYYYAFISHGKNGLGAIAQGGGLRSAPTSSAELQNCPSNNSNCTDPNALVLFSGPKNTEAATFFDDVVYAGSRQPLRKLCESLTPAQKVNAFVDEDFTGVSTGALPSSLTSSRALSGTPAGVQESTVTAGTDDPDLVLRLAGGVTSGDVVAISSAVPTDERPTYISFEWKPTALQANFQAGISIGLRATASDIGTNNNEDLFTGATDDGLTLRFYEDNNNNANGVLANRIYLCDDVIPACDNAPVTDNMASSGADTFTIALNQVFNIEAYDDGVNIWARITQISNPTNTATLNFAAVPVAQQDLARGSSLLIINHGLSTSEVDDLLVTRGSMGVAFDGTDDIVETAGDSHDTTTGDLTLEAWVNPDVLPSAQATLISKWVDNAMSSDGQAYRLYLTNSGGVVLDIAGDDAAAGTNITTDNFSFGYKLRTDQWTHVAVTYDSATQAAVLYIDGEALETITSTVFASSGVNDGTTAFSIGAERDNTTAIVHELDGTLTDIRVWDVVRESDQIFTTFNRRVPLTSGAASGLVVNWTLDRDTDRVFTSTTATSTLSSAAGADGTLTNAAFVPIFQRHIPVFSTAFCPTSTIIGPYQCDFRSTSQNDVVSIPNNLLSIYVKAWGGGGGGFDGPASPGFDSTGGGGGHSQAHIRSINSTPVIGNTISIEVGAGGMGSATGSPNNGAGGGGASGVWQDNVGQDFAGLVAGGGGGASNGDDNNVGGINSFDCNAVNDCGPGGGGGGPANILGVPNVATTRAPDDAENICGGRGGDSASFGSNPPGSAACESGGDDPTSNAGASGGGSVAGGASALGAGGAGYNGIDNVSGADDSTGGGGGGGGVSNATMTAGGGEAGGYDSVTIDTDATPDDNGSGFGGGGGAGFADSAGAIAPSGAAGVLVAPGSSTTDPDYAPSYCNGTTCITNPGRGGETGSFVGKQGMVILKW